VIFNSRWLVAAFSRRPENMSLDYGLTQGVLDNRKNFLSRLNIDYRYLVCAKQIHSANVKLVSRQDRGSGAVSCASAILDTDALITGESSLPLAVFTADCLSVFLYDPVNHAIGLVHAGWKGSRQAISAKAVSAMQEKFNTKASDLLIGFGPSIKQCCYEVGSEFRDYFAYGLQEKNGRYFLDLAGINKKQLLDSGIKQENIDDSGQCTHCSCDELFSFRREASKCGILPHTCGRIMSVIMLK